MVFSRKQEPKPTANNVEPLTAHGNAPANRGGGTPLQNANVAESVIGNDLSIEGQEITIRCQGYLRVNGDISADLHSQNLEVGRDGRISGSIAADTVNVFGHVSGAIQGQRVILHANSVVEGDIHSANLAIENGASFDGRSRTVRDLAEIRPQLTKDVSPPAQRRPAVGAQPPASAQAAAPIPPQQQHSGTTAGANPIPPAQRSSAAAQPSAFGERPQG
jgi:cytoskeletal protein CcmA (bactofilin family)